MSLNEFILNDAVVLDYSDTIENSVDVFKNTTYSHLPVLNSNKLVGCIAVEDLTSFQDKNKKIAEYEYAFENFFTSNTDLLIGVISQFSKSETNLLPVIDEQRNYLGFYDLNAVLAFYASSSFIQNEGTEIIIAKEEKGYSMAEAVQIAESNGAKVLGIFISKTTGNLTYLNLKIQTTIINDVIETFRRYDYKIISQVQDDRYLEELKNRSEYLQKFLDI